MSLALSRLKICFFSKGSTAARNHSDTTVQHNTSDNGILLRGQDTGLANKPMRSCSPYCGRAKPDHDSASWFQHDFDIKLQETNVTHDFPAIPKWIWHYVFHFQMDDPYLIALLWRSGQIFSAFKMAPNSWATGSGTSVKFGQRSCVVRHHVFIMVIWEIYIYNIYNI